MGTRRPFIPPRTPVFLGGEGASERGYGRWLDRLADHLGVRIAIRTENLGGGDPLALVKEAVIKIRHIERTRVRFTKKGLLLDSDLRGADYDRDQKAIAVARKSRIALIWQDPCHEGFLLRHFEGFQGHRPPDQMIAGRQLGNIWPDYKKGMDATGYETKLRVDHLVRIRQVEPLLNDFLNDIGWTEGVRTTV